MRQRHLIRALVFLLAAATVASLRADSLTKAERERLLNHLERTRQFLLDEVAGLSEAQANFKSAPDRWSVLECVEHITVSEDFFRQLVAEKMLQAPAAPEGNEELAGKEDRILDLLVKRNQKAQAPEGLRPTGRWASLEEAVEAFRKKRAMTVDFSETTQEDLRSRVAPHPVPAIGDLDGYQWLLFLSGHTERHTLQIQEVKAHPDFPTE